MKRTMRDVKQMLEEAKENHEIIFLTTYEVGDLLNYSDATIRLWAKSGKIKAFRAGRIWRIPSDVVLEMMG